MDDERRRSEAKRAATIPRRASSHQPAHPQNVGGLSDRRSLVRSQPLIQRAVTVQTSHHPHCLADPHRLSPPQKRNG
jgi:hypothetical protein